MHAICFALLLLSQFYYFKDLGSYKLNSQSLMQLLTIPLYLLVVYRAEFALRKMRPSYSPGSTWDDFELRSAASNAKADPTKDYNPPRDEMFCVAEKDGNVFQWIWLELMAFTANVIVIFVQLFLSYIR